MPTRLNARWCSYLALNEANLHFIINNHPVGKITQFSAESSVHLFLYIYSPKHIFVSRGSRKLYTCSVIKLSISVMDLNDNIHYSNQFTASNGFENPGSYTNLLSYGISRFKTNVRHQHRLYLCLLLSFLWLVSSLPMVSCEEECLCK